MVLKILICYACRYQESIESNRVEGISEGGTRNNNNNNNYNSEGDGIIERGRRDNNSRNKNSKIASGSSKGDGEGSCVL